MIDLNLVELSDSGNPLPRKESDNADETSACKQAENEPFERREKLLPADANPVQEALI